MAKARTATKAPSPSGKGAKRVKVSVDALDLRLAGAQRAVLAVVVVLAAAVVWRPGLDPFMVPKLTVVAVGAAALLTLAGVRAVRLGRLIVPNGPAVWIAAALAVALVLTTLTADNVGLSAAGQYRRSAGLLAYLSFLAVFLVAVRLYATSPDPRGLIRAVFLASGVVTGYGLLQVAGLDPYTWTSGGLAQTFSTMGNINFAAGYVAMTIPVLGAVVALSRWSRAWRYTGAVLLVLGLVYLAANGSLQGPAAAAAGLAVVGAAWLLARRRVRGTARTYSPARRLVWPVAALFGVITLGLLAGRLAPDVLAGLSERRYFWGAAVGIFADNPLLGTGLDSFRGYFTRYRAPEHGVFIGFDGADSPHSVPLSMFVAGGLPLGLTYLAFVGYTGWALIRGLLAATPDRLLTLAGFGGMWVAYQVQSLVSVDVPAISLLHFLAAALILAAARPPGSRSFSLPLTPAARGAFLPRARGNARGLVAAGLAVTLLLGLSSAWLAIRPLRADLAAGGAGQAADAPARLEALDTAVRLAPWEAEYRLMQGRALLEVGEQGRAYDAAVAAAEFRQGSSKLALGVADFAEKRGDAPTAAFWIDEALRRDPNNPLLLEEVAALVLAKGETERADELTQRAASLRVDHADF